MKEFIGKTAVVTGAASGIGYALAERFALEERMQVVLADVEREALERAVDQLATAGGDVAAVTTDVSDRGSVEALATEAVRRYGSVHVVCNNAGVGGHHYTTWEAPPSYWQWVLSVNLGGVINGVRAFLPRLVAQDEGHVVNTASLAGLLAMPFNAPYVASKHAVVGLSATLFHELSAMGSNVKVSVLCPGAVATEFSDADRNWPAGFGAGPPPSQELGAQHVHDAVRSLLRAGLQPAQVAELVVDAVRDERFMILTEPGLGSQVLASLSSCIDGHSPLSPQALRTGRSA